MTARDLIAQRFERDEVLRDKLRFVYKHLSAAVLSLGAERLTVHFDNEEQANVICGILGEEFGFVRDFEYSNSKAERVFSLLHYFKVEGDSPFTKFVE